MSAPRWCLGLGPGLLALGLLAGCQGAEGPTSPGAGAPPPAEAQSSAPEQPGDQPAQPQPEPVVGTGQGAKEKPKPATGLDSTLPPPPAGSPEPKPAAKKGALGQQQPTTLAEAQKEFARARAQLENAYTSGNRGAVALSSGDDRCKTACAAFSSLERSAAAICRLAGSADARCGDAKRVVEAHRKKVAACQCS